MARTKVLLTVAAAVVVSVVASQAVAKELKWGTDFNKAVKTAKTQGKLVLVDFWTPWCGWCKRLEEDVYSDEDIAKFVSDHFVPVKVNGDKHEDLVKKYKIRGYPTTLILDGSGQQIKKIIGYREAPAFLAELKEATELAKLSNEIPILQQKADGQGPEAAKASARLGYIYRRLGNITRARRYLERAKKLGYSSPSLELDLLLVNAKGADLINGLRKWCKANSNSPRRWEAYFELGMVQANMRLWTDAVDSFDKAAAGSPNSVWGTRSAMYARIIRERYLKPQVNDCPT